MTAASAIVNVARCFLKRRKSSDHLARSPVNAAPGLFITETTAKCENIFDLFFYNMGNAAVRYRVSLTGQKFFSFLHVRVSTYTYFCLAELSMLQCTIFASGAMAHGCGRLGAARLFAWRAQYALSLRVFPPVIWWLRKPRTRHRSCEDGLVLAVESCITGRSQYKRTNTVRQIIEMKGIT